MFVTLLICALLASTVDAQDRRGVSLVSVLPSICAQNEGALIASGASKGIYECGASNDWTLVSDLSGGGSGGDGVPVGASILIDAGTCPDGYEENTALNGKTLVGTLAANGNVGTTGGSDTITPAGTIAPITQVVSHTHAITITDPGHVHPEGYRNTGTAGTAGVQGASTANNASIAGGVLSATTGITAASAAPAGGVASITPTFTGTAVDNRSAFVRVIICRKT